MQSYIIQKTKSAGTLKTKAEKQIPKNGERYMKKVGPNITYQTKCSCEQFNQCKWQAQ